MITCKTKTDGVPLWPWSETVNSVKILKLQTKCVYQSCSVEIIYYVNMYTDCDGCDFAN